MASLSYSRYAQLILLHLLLKEKQYDPLRGASAPRVPLQKGDKIGGLSVIFPLLAKEGTKGRSAFTLLRNIT
jgi:hypothetical protein